MPVIEYYGKEEKVVEVWITSSTLAITILVLTFV
jgi:hypothetical protein